MIFEWYPQYIDQSEPGAVQEFIRKGLSKRPDLQRRVKAFLEKVRSVNDLAPFFASMTIAPVKDGLFEMRIPPRASGGVVRIYFCHVLGCQNKLMLLDAELKKQKAAARIENAVRRMNEYFEHIQGKKQ